MKKAVMVGLLGVSVVLASAKLSADVLLKDNISGISEAATNSLNNQTAGAGGRQILLNPHTFSERVQVTRFVQLSSITAVPAANQFHYAVRDINNPYILIASGVATRTSQTVYTDVTLAGNNTNRDEFSISNLSLEAGTYFISVHASDGNAYQLAAHSASNTEPLLAENGGVPFLAGANFHLYTMLYGDLFSLVSSVKGQGNFTALPAAQVISDTPALSGYFSDITTERDRSEAVTQTLPLLSGAAPKAILSALGKTNHIVQSRIMAKSGLSSGDEILTGKHFWVKVVDTRHDQDDRKGITGYDGNSETLVMGADTDVTDRLTLGLAFAYAQTDIDSNSNLNSLDVDSYQLVGYGNYDISESVEVSFQFDVGLSQIDGERVLTLPASGEARSDYYSMSYHLGSGISKTFAVGANTHVMPLVRLDYTRVDSDSYTEKGSSAIKPLLNRVDSDTTEALELGIGAIFRHRFSNQMMFDFEVATAYDAINSDATITSSYVGGGAEFKTSGIDTDPWITRVGLGLSSTLESGVELTARFDAEFRDDFLEQSASLNARWPF